MNNLLRAMPVLMSLIIKKAAANGLVPLLIPGKKVIMTFKCPRCSKMHMIKFIKKPDLRNKIWACKDCGFRKMSEGWKRRHGTFITATTV